MLAPARGKSKADADKTKANDHIPGANTRDWIHGLSDVKNHDPEQADQKASRQSAQVRGVVNAGGGKAIAQRKGDEDRGADA